MKINEEPNSKVVTDVGDSGVQVENISFSNDALDDTPQMRCCQRRGTKEHK